MEKIYLYATEYETKVVFHICDKKRDSSPHSLLVGIDDNYFEHDNQNNTKWTGDRAKNKILVLPKTGIPILVMEKLDTNVPYTDVPDWAGDYDSGQVGKDRRGRFKAYDYGFH